MNQRLTASGASKYWIEKSIDALKQAGFEEIKSDDIFNKITAMGNGNPFNVSFLEGTPENKTIIEKDFSLTNQNENTYFEVYLYPDYFKNSNKN